jgi:hypothetical protein
MTAKRNFIAQLQRYSNICNHQQADGDEFAAIQVRNQLAALQDALEKVPLETLPTDFVSKFYKDIASLHLYCDKYEQGYKPKGKNPTMPVAALIKEVFAVLRDWLLSLETPA